jgi:hypothetical protein
MFAGSTPRRQITVQGARYPDHLEAMTGLDHDTTQRTGAR